MSDKIGLNAIYREYSVSDGLRREAYGTLYKIFGGKKEIPEYTMEMYWYLSSLERMYRARLVYKEKVEKINDFKNQQEENIEIDEIQRKYNEIVFDFFKTRFKSCLDYLGHCFSLKVGVKKENINLAYWVVLLNGRPLVNSSLVLTDTYGFGEVQKALNQIFIAIKGLRADFYYTETDMASIMNDVNFIFKHTDLKITLAEVKKDETK